MKQLKTLKLFITLTVIFLTLYSCSKDQQYMSNAEIIGYDSKMCPCCGGIEITIDNVQNPNGNAYFLIGNLPSGFIGDNPKFPIAVKIDWEVDAAHCFGNYINITRIARR